jgi:phosphoserine phosphatase RsbU/P
MRSTHDEKTSSGSELMAQKRKMPEKKPNTANADAYELRSLFEFSNVVNSSLDLNFIISHFLLTLMGKLLSLRGVVLLARHAETFSIENIKGLPQELLSTEIQIKKVPNRLMYVEHEDCKKNPWMKEFRNHGIYLLIPLTVQDKVVGIAGLAPSIRSKKLPEAASTYVRSLANIAAAAIEKNLFIGELERVNRQLDGKVQELNTLFELSKEFNAVLDPDRIIKLLLFSTMGQIGVSKYAICLERDGSMETIISKFEKGFEKELCAKFLSLEAPVLVDCNTKKSDLSSHRVMNDYGIQVLVPLRHQNVTKGILAIGERIKAIPYKAADLEILSSLGNLAIISLENARLFQQAIEKQKMEDELLIAKEIQQGLLPESLPKIESFNLAAVNISSKQVGGDYYDIIPLSRQHYVFAIGDVSGKGTPASLLMASLQATIRALVPLGLSLGELTKRVNDLICDNTTSGRFITFFWGILDCESKILKYVNAGHNLPYVIHQNGTVERLDRGGIILGIMKTVVPYQEGEIKLSKGDLLVMFTDGVSESMDSNGDEFGEDRLEKLLIEHRQESSSSVLEHIVDAVKIHSKNTIQSDDITLVIAQAIA